MSAFNSIPTQLAKDNRKFQYKVIKSGARAYDYETPLDWIKASGVIIKCNRCNEGKLAFNGFKGALTENYVAFTLTVNGYTPYYWESKGQSEVDFLIQDNLGNIIPIQVKAADNVRTKSLNEYIKRYSPPYVIRVSGKNFGFENGIKSVPLYATFLI